MPSTLAAEMETGRPGESEESEEAERPRLMMRDET